MRGCAFSCAWISIYFYFHNTAVARHLWSQVSRRRVAGRERDLLCVQASTSPTRLGAPATVVPPISHNLLIIFSLSSHDLLIRARAGLCVRALVCVRVCLDFHIFQFSQYSNRKTSLDSDEAQAGRGPWGRCTLLRTSFIGPYKIRKNLLTLCPPSLIIFS